MKENALAGEVLPQATSRRGYSLHHCHVCCYVAVSLISENVCGVFLIKELVGFAEKDRIQCVLS